ncbi:MBL fold metallo-hydrolase [Demequina lutea]|uniref:L-ascorbate metabolism protein UlaG (Beta-lactamase superfamily) n=1 Tax=Demequina lutea TaxID=431489 RepID=A0A7Y9ZAJ6_9MICO|nr:MBL fold metallo-hydrolase [Demequina lutea]NYI41013.1 L-ascorbate metabolism protein UlaG (beta-lactamase superfamily) [Demequina lutea]
MRLTKHAHACIDVEHEGRRIVIDPGAFTPNARDLLANADAVLVTHSHMDHLDPDAVADAMRARIGLVLYGPEDVVASLREEFGERVRAVKPGDVLEVAGLSVSVYGGLHAEVLPSIPRAVNVGFLLGGRVFHPGDSLDPPDVEVETLLVPVSGPWIKLAEAAQFVSAVKPLRAVAIHEVILSPIGLALAAHVLGNGSSPSVPVEFLEPGTEL